MASFKAKFPVLQELFSKKPQGGPLPPSPAGRGLGRFVSARQCSRLTSHDSSYRTVVGAPTHLTRGTPPGTRALQTVGLCFPDLLHTCSHSQSQLSQHALPVQRTGDSTFQITLNKLCLNLFSFVVMLDLRVVLMAQQSAPPLGKDWRTSPFSLIGERDQLKTK